jgi:hypothetical protein
VLLLGPPGVGKTRLRREATFALASRGFQVAAAGAAPDDALAPFSVLRTLLRELLAVSPRPDEDEAVAAARRVTTEVALCSALASLLGAGAAPAAGPAQAAARAALTAASAQRPILLVVDDAHWADDATLELLESLARGAVEAPIAVLAEARPDLLDRRPRAAERTACGSTSAPLPPERARELAALCLGRPHPRAVARRWPTPPTATRSTSRSWPATWSSAAGAAWHPDHRRGGHPGAPRPRLVGEARELLRAAAVLGRASAAPSSAAGRTAGFDPARSTRCSRSSRARVIVGAAARRRLRRSLRDAPRPGARRRLPRAGAGGAPAPARRRRARWRSRGA